MKFKKKIRYLFKILFAIFIIALAYFIYAVIWISNFNADQKKMAENLAPDFYQTSQIIRDPNGYFGVVATINGQYVDTLLLDTQASTSLAKQEVLDQYSAEYWGRKPMPTFNFYKQIYFSKLYKVNDLKIGDCALKGVLFSSIPKDNAMYNTLYRSVLGRTVIKNMVWKFDMDKNQMSFLSLKNEKLLQREAVDFTFIKDGISHFPLYSEQTDSLNLMLDLGANYDVIIDKTVYEKLLEHHTPRKYVNFRRVGLTDTIAEFSKITMYCNGMMVPNCTLDYIPTLNKNVVGNIFIGKMNFILANSDLYVQQRINTLSNCRSELAALGLSINIRNDNICVTTLEINGYAENAGLKLGDKVLSIDNGAVNVDFMSVSSGKLEKYIQEAECLILEIERDGVRQIYTVKAIPIETEASRDSKLRLRRNK